MSDRQVRKTAVRPRVARHEIREEFERRILSGETKPGELLGLVKSIDRLGVFVDKLDVSRICEDYQLREMLEGLAARLARRNVGRADLASCEGWRMRCTDWLRMITPKQPRSIASSICASVNLRATTR
jgi:DNA-binding GntR family transcriptional regulator